jgi:sigma-B regulation protein RsbU (phosphoserine phosphatase)
MRNRPVNPYRQALDRFRREARGGPFLERVSELVSLLDLTTTLAGGVDAETLDAALGTVNRELGVTRAVLFVRRGDGALGLRASRGFAGGPPAVLEIGEGPGDVTVLGPGDDAHDRHGFALLVPIPRGNRPIAVLALGPREDGRSYGEEEKAFLRSVAACAATSIENDLLHDELHRVNQKLSMKVFELHNLFDSSRELAGGFGEEAIRELVATTVMGHFLVSRCALYLLGPQGLTLAHERGLREGESAPIPPEEARVALEALREPQAVADLPRGPLRARLETARLALVVPLGVDTRVEGVLAIGERASGKPFSEEDRDFAQTLARQALAALENARLQRIRQEKQRQDRELQIAREIQHNLFPHRPPEIRGFEVAAASHPCYEVGGDSYDWISLGGERLALVIADVSGKGTPASLLMASVHASVRALAGTAEPARLVERLNGFLFASTQAGRFVTLFYAELDAASGRLAYVNAGHVPPFRLAADGTPSRLAEGGPALGILDDSAYDVGEVSLRPGDVVAMVTDGVTEANSANETEFGDERVGEVLRRLSAESASAILEGLVGAVNEWANGVGCSDDLTAVVLKAR